MDKDIVIKLRSSFEAMVQAHPDTGTEFWCARDLQMLLGYSQWRNFEAVIKKAITSCQTAGCNPADHFARISKMVDVGSGTKRPIDDIALTRYACYLIAQNGDPAKDPIAFAQSYFAVQTRKQEIIERRLAEAERVSARKKLTRSEKELSGIIVERIRDNESFAMLSPRIFARRADFPAQEFELQAEPWVAGNARAKRIRSKGDQALFGGRTTRDMKQRLSVPTVRPLADFLPTITIKAKDFANEITNFNIKEHDLRTVPGISGEHVKNNQEVRGLLVQRGIVPERLPPAEDVKKVERRLAAERKKLPRQVKHLEGGDPADGYSGSPSTTPSS